MKALVGYTGFVGSNIYESESFEAVYNSKNITEAYGTRPELLIYAGVRAEKYMANSFPEKDLEAVLQAADNIRRINPKKLVLISTIDVFKEPCGVSESSGVVTEGLHPYGYNRYELEKRVRQDFPNTLIVRLPGLFGKNMKKNFIYDFINRIPFVLTERKFNELSAACPELKKFYCSMDNGYYKVRGLTEDEKNELKKIFDKLDFCALNFTDSRSVYQFYPLKRLWKDIQAALQLNIELLHAAVEPVSAGELYKYLTGNEFVNELPGVAARYNFKTEYDSAFDGSNGYLCSKKFVLSSIKKFVRVNGYGK